MNKTRIAVILFSIAYVGTTWFLMADNYVEREYRRNEDVMWKAHSDKEIAEMRVCIIKNKGVLDNCLPHHGN